MTKHKPKKASIALVHTADRATGIAKVIDLLNSNPVHGKKVLLKPNFNTADEFPGSTHNDTLKHLVLKLKDMGASGITVADRSGPASTREVIREKGVDRLCEELGVNLLNFEDLPKEGWIRIKPEQSHWIKGFDFARPVLDAEAVVTTCCLKTHGYGAVFTMSLKLAVGMTHKHNMAELHSSLMSMRKMIAELSQAYTPSLILMDAIEAFTDRGPMSGPRKRLDVLVAGTDRVAIDAVGLALLKLAGSNKAIMDRKIFEQEQISRAVELGLGVSGPDQIELVTRDPESSAVADKVREILLQG